MAWTAPSTRATGDLITASIWNSNLTDNLTYLKTEVDKYAKVLSTVTEVSFASNSSEQTLLTGTIPGGTLGSSSQLQLFIWLLHNNGTGSSQNLVFRLKYGGTTIATMTASVGGGGDFWYELFGLLRADGSTSTQEGYLFASAYSVNAGGTAAIDSTVDQTFTLTGQAGVNSAAFTHRFKGAALVGPW